VNIGNIESKIGENSGSNSGTGFSSNLNASIASQMRRRQNRVIRVTGLAGRFYEHEMEAKNRRRSPIMIPKEKLKNELESERFGESRSKKLVIDTTSRKSKEIKFEEDTGWSFGRLFRITLIILFILVIVWVVGSQLAQVSKNME
jgi:hypothetical protein